jgi:NAD(P)-dependent dehydrogenase (short-subunit alcohol dehydrogenase family)
MAISLKGQAAVVVGASSGMGFETALALAREGVSVLACARRKEPLAALEKEGIRTRVVDVTKRADVDDLVAAAGKIDLLVYCAGLNVKERAMSALTPETWDEMIAVNLTGAFNCTKAVLEPMKKAGGGLIVYISSVAANLPDPVSGAAYQAAKRGLAGLAHGTRLEEKKAGIRTTLICPGMCDTELLQKRPTPPSPEILAQILKPSDVADAVVAVARLHPRAVVTELELLPSRVQ